MKRPSTATAGRPPKPARLRRSKRHPFLMTEAEYLALRRYCARRNLDANEVIRQALAAFLESETAGERQKGGGR